MASTNQSSLFGNNLFHTIQLEDPNKNIIISPTSIRACLALAYLGAEGTTASELEQGLYLQSGSNKEEVAKEFEYLLSKTQTNDGGAQLKIANRVYIDQKFEISPRYNELAEKYFGAAAEKVDFVNAKITANKINSWVEKQTQNKIQNLITPDILDKRTASILVNAIYFKADWLNKFENYATAKKEFYLNDSSKVLVDMMQQEDSFLYGELDDLNAISLEMEYLDTDLTMLIVLPKQLNGLAKLEAKLKDMNLIEITTSLRNKKVRVKLPKFQIEYDISLKSILEQLGMKTMFTQDANFSALLSLNEELSISEVKHKAFIEVNENGTTAAGATYFYLDAKISLDCFIDEPIFDFNADRPFFAIKDKSMIYFAGALLKF